MGVATSLGGGQVLISGGSFQARRHYLGCSLARHYRILQGCQCVQCWGGGAAATSRLCLSPPCVVGRESLSPCLVREYSASWTMLYPSETEKSAAESGCGRTFRLPPHHATLAASPPPSSVGLFQQAGQAFSSSGSEMQTYQHLHIWAPPLQLQKSSNPPSQTR